MKTPPDGTPITGLRLLMLLLAIVAASVAIHGYHYGIEDETIYLPAVKAHLNPALYPHDAIFFQPQTRLAFALYQCFHEDLKGSRRIAPAF